MKSIIWNNYLKKQPPDAGVKFSHLFGNLQHDQMMEGRQVNVQSVFLTLLHLSNEMNLEITQIDGDLAILQH
jgi:hypothetical protein